MKKNKKRFPKYTEINPSTQVSLALALLAIAILASRGEVMSTWETSLFYHIYQWPGFLYPIFLFFTQFGSIYLLWLLLAIYLIGKRYHTVLRLLLTGILAYLISGFVKDIWGRSRPDELLTDVVNLDYARGPGFPSGHVALAVALAFTIGHYLPKKYNPLMVIWIIGVSLSRVYLGVHAPLDVMGGFAIGWLAYALFRHVRLYDIKFGKKRQRKASVANPFV